MKRRRGLQDLRALCSGPGKICQALGITRAQNALALDAPPFQLLAQSGAGENRQGRADRDHESGFEAVALWIRGIEISQQAFQRARFAKSIEGVTRRSGSPAIAIGRKAKAAIPVASQVAPAITDTIIATP